MIMFPGRDDSTHNHFIVPLLLVLLSAFHDAVISQTTSAVRLRGSGAPMQNPKKTRAMQFNKSLVNNACPAQIQRKLKRSAVVHVNPHQRSLPTTQAHYPTTEDTAGFCLLCCQPEPVPLSLSTRTSQLTLRCPCGVPTWSGQAINVARRT